MGGRQRPAEGVRRVLSSGLTVPVGARRRRHRRQHARRPAAVLAPEQRSQLLGSGWMLPVCTGHPCCCNERGSDAAAAPVAGRCQLWQRQRMKVRQQHQHQQHQHMASNDRIQRLWASQQPIRLAK